ncbi:MAG: ATPase, T2SS/T4P/T4SS family, partial [Gammaproteobacteria bacterium]|nr:ATPase, T2SS/T4P/T4SS family [Gammaproteobacteria bacterium]
MTLREIWVLWCLFWEIIPFLKLHIGWEIDNGGMNSPSFSLSSNNTLHPDTLVSRWLDETLESAFQSKSSDIHLEPTHDALQVRIRVDGHLYLLTPPQENWKDRIISKIKVMASMDIAEKRLPQDGRINLKWEGNPINLRINTLPTIHGEKVVIRIQYIQSESLGLDSLGYTDGDLGILLNALSKPHGLILITGPTGAGKTLSLYSCLMHLNSPKVNISTVEDPIEIALPGIN